MKYYKLLDNDHKNTIIRANGRSQQKYVHDRGWVESGIMMKYFCDEDALFGLYEEISEK